MRVARETGSVRHARIQCRRTLSHRELETKAPVDDETKVANLKSRVRTFCEARDWDQFHGPKDLAIGLATEAGELLEIFRFLSDEQCAAKLADPESRRAIENELADVFFFLLRFAQRFDIDLDAALAAKMKLNAERYPVEKSRGKNLKYGDL